jgi:hypothetical protein
MKNLNQPEAIVGTVQELLAAAQQGHAQRITVSGQIVDSPSFRLAPGQALLGADESASVSFVSGADGVQVSSNNSVQKLRLRTAPDRRAIFNDTSVDTLGHIKLHEVYEDDHPPTVTLYRATVASTSSA